MGFISQNLSNLWQYIFSKKDPDSTSRVSSQNVDIFSKIDLVKFQKIVRYSISNPEIFYQAFTHRSYLQFQNNDFLKSNERLEFLGDSVLNMVVGDYLFQNFKTASEGDLTKLRSRLVNRKALAAYARELELLDFLFLSNSASQTLNQGSETILADSFEALIGAIYLDGGLEPVKKFITERILSAMRLKTVVIHDTNYKSLLLEHSQSIGNGAPRYNTVKSEGPDHARIFTVDVIINGEPYGTGSGKNKKEAEQAAAYEALKKLKLI